MWCQLVAIVVIIGCHLSDARDTSHIVQMQGPCNFLNTINITSGHLDQNGNFHHKGVVFKKGLFAEYNYVVENLTELVKVEPHIRGCLCDIKPCIRLCCVGEPTNSSTCVKTETLVVPTHDEDEEIELAGNRYGVLIGRPCGLMYKLEPEDYPDDRWYFVVSYDHLSLLSNETCVYLTPISLFLSRSFTNSNFSSFHDLIFNASHEISI